MNARRGRMRGTASAEAVLVIPVLALVLLGTSWLQRRVRATQHELVLAHACALYVAQQGCTDRAQAAPICRDATLSDGRTLEVTSRQTHGALGFLASVADWPVIEKVVPLLFGNLRRAERRFEAAGPFSRPSRRHVSSAIACNPRPMAWDKRVKDIACRAARGVKGLSALFGCR